jgi:misacylated tRNA(Ala) deacylase
MPTIIRAAFLEDAYLRECAGTVLHVNDQGGIVLDATNFYATSGGQPGDTGFLIGESGARTRIAATVTGQTKAEIVLVAAPGETRPAAGERVMGEIDWERRYRHMRMHTACHILSVVCPYPITSANIGEEESRVDFDIPEAGADKERISAAMMEIIAAAHPVYSNWIEEAELDANPAIVRSKNVRPPRGLGRIRLVAIGRDAAIDSQPCGGTHVANTSEVGEVHIARIEKKGRENRRFRIRFGAAQGS